MLPWAFAGLLHSQVPTGTSGSAAKSLTLAISLPNAITIAPGGRTFLVIAKQKGQDVPQIAEYAGGQLKPYPDASWNQWKGGTDATHAFVHANSIRFGPDGTLWVVDFGSPEMKQPVVPHGPKLVAINIATGKVVNTVYFDSVVHPESAVDDVRFSGDYAYLTDAGWPGFIVVHMPDGRMHRALNDDPATTAPKPLRAEGHVVLGKDGQPLYFHNDQLEISPDGKTMYFQPNSGPMSAIALAYLNDPAMLDSERHKKVRPFLNSGTAGGTAIDHNGNLYITDCDRSAVLKVTPDGKTTVLIRDPRLVWPDALWITADGRLWIPAAQMNLTPSLNHGKLEVELPGQVFTVDIGAGPAANDHK